MFSKMTQCKTNDADSAWRLRVRVRN